VPGRVDGDRSRHAGHQVVESGLHEPLHLDGFVPGQPPGRSDGDLGDVDEPAVAVALLGTTPLEVQEPHVDVELCLGIRLDPEQESKLAYWYAVAQSEVTNLNYELAGVA